MQAASVLLHSGEKRIWSLVIFGGWVQESRTRGLKLLDESAMQVLSISSERIKKVRRWSLRNRARTLSRAGFEGVIRPKIIDRGAHH